jgi:WD40 repeat protein
LMTAVGLSPGADWALPSDRNTLVLWRASTGAAEQYWSSPAEVVDLALGTDGELALLGLTDHRAALYNVKRGGVIRSFPHEGPVTTVALSADGNRALTGSDDGSAVLWNTANGEALVRQWYSTDVYLVRMSLNGKRALAATRYDGVSIWSTQDGGVWKLPQSEEHLKRGLRVSAARFSDDGAYLLIGRPDGLVQLWDLEARTLMYSWRLPKRKMLQPIATVVLDVAFTKDLNRYRALSSNGFVHDLSY